MSIVGKNGRGSAQAVLNRIDDAFEVVCQRLAQDERYRDDDLIERIKKAFYQFN